MRDSVVEHVVMPPDTRLSCPLTRAGKVASGGLLLVLLWAAGPVVDQWTDVTQYDAPGPSTTPPAPRPTSEVIMPLLPTACALLATDRWDPAARSQLALCPLAAGRRANAENDFHTVSGTRAR